MSLRSHQVPQYSVSPTPSLHLTSTKHMTTCLLIHKML